MQIKQLEKLLSIEEEGRKSDAKPEQIMVQLTSYFTVPHAQTIIYNCRAHCMQPSSKTIDELRAQVKTLTSQNEHKDALVLNCNMLGPL